MIDILASIFAAYIITAVLVSGNILFKAREWAKKKTPWLIKGKERRHMFDCRLCVGAWVSLAVYLSLVAGHWSLVFLIYGASYFLATQER